MFADMTLQELNALAERQRRQIEDQEKSLQAKQKKLSVLTQQSQQNAASDDRLRKLRERALEQEGRLKQYRIEQPHNTALLSAELTSVRNLLESKQRELSQSMVKVDKITTALTDLQKTQDASASGEMGKLNRELGALQNLNSEQSKKLETQRELLRRKQNESAELDRKILDLADRINKKRMTQSQLHSGQLYTNVAPVKPVIQSSNGPTNKQGYAMSPTKPNNISQRHEVAPTIAGQHHRNNSDDSFKNRRDKQDSIFQYRNPPKNGSAVQLSGAGGGASDDRPPPPTYQQTISQRRLLPGGSPEGKNAFDEWRKRIANHPRPLKKRSSFSEAEGPNGPNVPRLLYKQIHKHFDPLFHDPRNVPPEEDEEGSESSGKNEKSPQVPKSPPRVPPEPGSKLDPHQRSSPSRAARMRNVRGILKAKDAPTNHKRRVQFDPLALLLDASLEGEIELVKKVIDKVSNPSAANDEGITALHNSVCAGHFDVVRFLVHWGVDINAADSDGWTPLHCAASCNSVQMVKFLVENGAQIFAETFSDNETAGEKCEELDEGYGMCSDYLYGTQEKLGSVNKGCVYALFDYDAQNDDEIGFVEGDLLSIQRKSENGDDRWWLARHSATGKEGYVPRNYLGMWPRIKAQHHAD